MVAHRKKFLEVMADLRTSHLSPPPPSDERAAIPPPNMEYVSQATRVNLSRREIFNTNEGQK